ncbi:MAG: hypothetical protein U9O20_01745 [Patescibacteria group bacterium]|nr:hypothetical protein [Patescibacteria group bacterium]
MTRVISDEWQKYKNDCHACNQLVVVSSHLVRSIWRVLNSEKQYLSASIALAYLRGDDADQINHIFNGFEQLKESCSSSSNGETVFLMGILTVEELDESGDVKNCWYGLV